MKHRCFFASDKDYKNYGGRGITVCERWLVFENFYADMGERPQGLTLDRINSDGNYEPSNCRWATQAEQTANRRHHNLAILVPVTHCVNGHEYTASNTYIKTNGKRQCYTCRLEIQRRANNKRRVRS